MCGHEGWADRLFGGGFAVQNIWVFDKTIKYLFITYIYKFIVLKFLISTRSPYNFINMANQSAKKNEIAIRGKIKFMHYTIYPLTAVFILINMFSLYNENISYWHFICCLLVAITTHFCINRIVNSWQLQLPSEASEYFIDVLAMNVLVCILDPITHKVWYIYWLIVVFVVWQLLKWLWDYITPKYEQTETEDDEKKREKKERKEKKQKIKYIKK